MQINPSILTGGDPTSGVVSLSGAAPAAGAVVSLSSSNPAVVSVPSSVTVGSGSSAWGFNVTTAAVSSTTSVTDHGDLRRHLAHRDDVGDRSRTASASAVDRHGDRVGDGS